MWLQEIAWTPPWKHEGPITAEGCAVVMADTRATLNDNTIFTVWKKKEEDETQVPLCNDPFSGMGPFSSFHSAGL